MLRAMRRGIALWIGSGWVLLVAAAPAVARAHFQLKAPTSWMSQDALGSPQKMGPCGDEGGGTATGTVTAFKPGDTVTITIDEKVFHPGHYRIALARDRSELPVEPPVTAGSTPCGTVPVASPAVFPVLADGVFDHTAPFDKPQTTTVTLPADMTCDRCTLQVIQFMSDHGLNNPGGCFYHHCADVAITPDGGGGVPGNQDRDGGSDAAISIDAGGPRIVTDAGPIPPAASGGGCSCDTAGAPSSPWAFAYAAAAWAAAAGASTLRGARRRRARSNSSKTSAPPRGTLGGRKEHRP
jgi:hypothetical protein